MAKDGHNATQWHLGVTHSACCQWPAIRSDAASPNGGSNPSDSGVVKSGGFLRTLGWFSPLVCWMFPLPMEVDWGGGGMIPSGLPGWGSQ